MTQHPGPGDLLATETATTAVARLARQVLDVYRGADDDLRHAVHDSLLAGLPPSGLLAEEDAGLELAALRPADQRAGTADQAGAAGTA